MLAAAFLLAAAAPTSLPPVDRCGGDPEFTKVRQRLEHAVRTRDIDVLVSLVSDDLGSSFGGQKGREDFQQQWLRASEGRASLWKELGAALRLGCAKAMDGSGKEYRAFPAMFVTGDDLDGFSTWVALPGAVLRSAPNATARATMRLPAWTVLSDVEHDGGAWIDVRTPRGRHGFVQVSQARSLLDYRIVFGRRDGQWRITAFVAGD